MHLSKLDAWITREQPEAPECACGNELHYASEQESGVCDDCTAAEANVEQALGADVDAALGLGAATELPLTPDQRAEIDHLVRCGGGIDTPRNRAAAERQVRLYPQFYPAVRA